MLESGYIFTLFTLTQIFKQDEKKLNKNRILKFEFECYIFVLVGNFSVKIN